VSRTQQILGLGIVVAFALGLGYAGWRMMRNPSQGELCQASGRPIHADMRTVAFVGDKRGVYCCPTCALTEAAQMHLAVRFEQVADYETGDPLRPADAFAVEGSGVIPCFRPHNMVNRDGQAVPMDFDRCSPSIIAFANLAAAKRFASDHGGEAGKFLEIVARPLASPRR
jgi:hypothetical protein